ncbi:hypothetical protein D3C87_1744140 [compost metagenome]
MSSAKSLIRASTSLTCSCFLRRRVVGPAANSSVSVTKSIPSSIQLKPTLSPAVAMPTFSVVSPWNSASESNAGGFTPLARKKSSRVSRRPALSASSSTRCCVLRMCACKRASGSSAPRNTDRSPSF